VDEVVVDVVVEVVVVVELVVVGGARIRGVSTEEVMQKEMDHAKKVKHPEMTEEQMNMLKTQIKDV
jgi:predicted small metal-binding protein